MNVKQSHTDQFTESWMQYQKRNSNAVRIWTSKHRSQRKTYARNAQDDRRLTIDLKQQVQYNTRLIICPFLWVQDRTMHKDDVLNRVASDARGPILSVVTGQCAVWLHRVPFCFVEHRKGIKVIHKAAFSSSHCTVHMWSCICFETEVGLKQCWVAIDSL